MSVLNIKIRFFQSVLKLISSAGIILFVSCLAPSTLMAQTSLEDAPASIVLVLAVDQDTRGTGFVISDDGYILTNNHVADGGGRYGVRFSGSDDFIEASFIASDENFDIALLKIEGFTGQALLMCP